MIQCRLHPCMKYATGFGPCCRSPYGGTAQARFLEHLEIRFPPNILMQIFLTRNGHPLSRPVQWNSLNQAEKIQEFGLEISMYSMLPKDWTDGELPSPLPISAAWGRLCFII